MKVTIIGQGYVGLTVALFASNGNEIIGFDIDPVRVDSLSKGLSHVEGVSSQDLVAAMFQGKLRFTSDPQEINGSEVIVIAVPTPLNDKRDPDLSFVENACKIIGENLDNAALIINESTSFPGTVRNVIKPLIEKYSHKKLEHLFSVSPERVDPGREDFNQSNTPRLYSGLTPEASKRTYEFYSTFCENLIEVSSPEVAEAAKLFENSFRQVNIALVNEFAQIANALGISARETLDAAGTKPYGFMKFSPSTGVGGHCIPIDPSYLAYVASQHGVEATFIERANEVNLNMPNYIASRVVADHGGSIKGKRVIVIGVAYKANVADLRETPAEILIEELHRLGASVTWHDPLVAHWNGQNSAELVDADIAIVVTKHDVISVNAIMNCSPYVFDTTGKVSEARQL
jgi:UDP-N-acetyl-D-glucosamine dehydrogenase